MLKLFKNIITIIVAVVFASAATGVYFINHHCNKSGNSDLHFKPVTTCECSIDSYFSHSNSAIKEEAEDHCCKAEIIIGKDNLLINAKDECCSFKNFFIKVFSPFFKLSVKISEESIFHISYFLSEITSVYSTNDSIPLLRIFEPPPLFSFPVYLKNNILRL